VSQTTVGDVLKPSKKLIKLNLVEVKEQEVKMKTYKGPKMKAPHGALT
jgi:hypothetical protein